MLVSMSDNYQSKYLFLFIYMNNSVSKLKQLGQTFKNMKSQYEEARKNRKKQPHAGKPPKDAIDLQLHEGFICWLEIEFGTTDYKALAQKIPLNDEGGSNDLSQWHKYIHGGVFPTQRNFFRIFNAILAKDFPRQEIEALWREVERCKPAYRHGITPESLPVTADFLLLASATTRLELIRDGFSTEFAQRFSVFFEKIRHGLPISEEEKRLITPLLLKRHPGAMDLPVAQTFGEEAAMTYFRKIKAAPTPEQIQDVARQFQEKW